MSNGTAGSDALTQLVRAALDQPGMSYQVLSDASIDPETGAKVGGTWLHKLVKGNVVRAPEPRVLRGLAVGLRRPLPEVKRAAAEQWLQYTNTELSGLPEDVRVILGHLEGMTPGDVSRARAVIEALSSRLNESSPEES
ncbi:hypothetical protein [Kitasatospora sp. GP82]|uniref:hypothetical protein n=1 Tax=Kitasatospora sp. GP82 TaxID=3035089 RepID=UPI00247701EA|nr:hypothetical protein [Kitasatospora sp. GP82]MDH6123416.1 hypothetical protein [Kitasatospora sp. GP82]